jgi:hypothetical protein
MLKFFLVRCIAIIYTHGFESDLQPKTTIFCNVTPYSLIVMYQCLEEPVSQIIWYHSPKNCGLFVHLCWRLWVSALYLFLIFPLHVFLPAASMELVKLYVHSPMCFHGEQRNRLLPLYSLTWCDHLWYARGKDKCWDPKYLSPAPSL